MTYFDNIRLIGRNEIVLPIMDFPTESRWILKAVDGLGPPDQEVHLAKKALGGHTFTGKRPAERTMIFRIGLNPFFNTEWTPATARYALYSLLSSGKNDTVEIQVRMGDILLGTTHGWIQRFEIVPFAKDPEVQITIVCGEAYFDSVSVYNNEMNAPSPVTINYAGTAPTGGNFFFSIVSGSSTFWILDQFARPFKININLMMNDQVVITTNQKNRGVWRNRGTTSEYIASYIEPSSKWFLLNPGPNTWTFSPNARLTDAVYKQKLWGF